MPATTQESHQTNQTNEAGATWTEWFTAWRLSLLIVVLLFALYPGVLLGTASFFWRDFGLFTYPVAEYTHDSFWRGEIPLWNPLNHCGIPFLAQWNTTVCYPLSLIYILLPLPWSLNLFCLGHLVLAGLGMYFLTLQWTGNRLAASIAGLAFALNGLMLNSLMWTSNLAALSWQPIVILCLQRAWRHGGRHLIVAAIVGAIQMLAGSPEIILFTWLLIAGLWVIEVCRTQSSRWQIFLRVGSVILLVAALAAIQILPFLDLLAHSEREPAATSSEAWPLPLWGWANYIVPQFHCAPTAMGSFFLQGQSWTTSYYVGLAALALALVGMWRARQFHTGWLTAAALGGIVLALGPAGGVYSWLKGVLPMIGLARYPIKFIAIPTFAIPLLAAYGFSQLQPTHPATHNRSGLKPLFVLSALLILVAAGILLVAHRFPKPGDSWTHTWHSAAASITSLIVVTCIIRALLRADSARQRISLGIAILALIGLDPIVAGLRQNPVVTTKAFGPLELNMTERPRLGENRATLSPQALSFLSRASTSDPLAYCVGVRGALFDNCNLLENIPKVDGFASVRLREQAVIVTALANLTNEFPAALANFLGVAQITASNTPSAWEARPDHLPLATIGSQPVFAEPAETLRQITSATFQPRKTVYLPPDAALFVTATNPVRASVRVRSFTAHHEEFETETDASALLVLAQTYYHPWRAYVDGQSVKIWRANYAFQAIEVPRGRSAVKLVYEDRCFWVGAILSGMTLLGCVIGLIRSRGKFSARNGTTTASPLLS